ncbi:MAG: hypothetical protein V1733_06915, partial [bacterium]
PHYCELCKTHFRLMVSLYRVGLFTYWVSTIGFKEHFYPPIMGLSWRNVLRTSDFWLHNVFP